MSGYKKTKPGITSYIIIAAALVLVILLVSGVFEKARVGQIEISYGPGARETAQRIGKSDADLQRDSKLFNLEMSGFDAFKDTASAGIDYTIGYLYVESVQKTGRNAIRLVINSREPVAVISGSRDAVIDRNGIILEFRQKNINDGLIQITGFDLTDAYVNGMAKTESVEGTLVEDALNVVNTIRDNGYGQWFTAAAMLEYREVRLTAYTGIPVVINLRFDILKSLDIAHGIIEKGVTTGGKIVVTGDKGYFDPDSGDSTSARGM